MMPRSLPLLPSSDALHIPDKNSALCLRHAWSRDYNYCPCGALGDSARALSLCAEPYRTIAGGERTLKSGPTALCGGYKSARLQRRWAVRFVLGSVTAGSGAWLKSGSRAPNLFGFFTVGWKHSTIAHQKCPSRSCRMMGAGWPYECESPNPVSSLGEARRGYSETASKDLRLSMTADVGQRPPGGGQFLLLPGESPILAG